MKTDMDAVIIEAASETGSNAGTDTSGEEASLQEELPVLDARGRPDKMTMKVMGGTLRTLGADMYSNLGKVLVEFIANAHDADATYIRIDADMGTIARERLKLRQAKKAQPASQADVGVDDLFEGGSEAQPAAEDDVQDDDDHVGDGTFDFMKTVLPSKIKVVIKDDGEGMTWEEIRDNFLPVNRRRRRDGKGRETLLKTNGGRFVQGRKGVGKLAAFGAATKVEIVSKKSGEDYATQVVIDANKLHEDKSIERLKLPTSYIEGIPIEEHGTTITLTGLLAEAFSEKEMTVRSTIQKRFFGLKPEDFSIYLNDQLVEPYLPNYQFLHPATVTLDDIRNDEIAERTVLLPGVGQMEFRYYVGFRRRNEHLPSTERGAYVYCNNRLAAGPSLFGLGSGMHSFHSTDYMECMVEANDLDRNTVDLISTNRGEFKEGNEVVAAFLEAVRTVMRDAIKAHGIFLAEEAEEKLRSDPVAIAVARQIEFMPSKMKVHASKILSTFGREFGVESQMFQELAPTLVKSINAHEVLVTLATGGASVASVREIADQLHQLSEVEKFDSLKLFRARRDGINKLSSLYERSRELWKKKGIEKEFHQLLKENPWLVKPEYSSYVTSDRNINTVVSQIANYYQIDQFATIKDDDGLADDTRPDLVFLMQDTSTNIPSTINVVELKSTTIPLSYEHYEQIGEYIFKVEEWCASHLKTPPAIHGFLIGEMPDPEKSTTNQRRLIKERQKAGPETKIRVIGISELIAETRQVHLAAIDALDADLKRMEEEG